MTYSGYANYTNNDGYFSFPKHHTSPDLRIIVCAETDYETLKETVSQIRINSKIQAPALSVYQVTKQKENLSDEKTAAQKKKQAAAQTKQDKKTDEGTTKSDTPAPNEVWSYTVTAIGKTVPANGIQSTDLVIHCDPSMIYMQDQACYYDSTEETSHFILPNESLFLLKTPPPPALERADILTESVESSIETDSVASKNNDTDSMGNPLPGVVRAAWSSTD